MIAFGFVFKVELVTPVITLMTGLITSYSYYCHQRRSEQKSTAWESATLPNNLSHPYRELEMQISDLAKLINNNSYHKW